MERLEKRLLRYVAYDTQSDENSNSFPSTDKQLILLRDLKSEMEQLGLTEVAMDKYGYVTGTIPASEGFESAPVIGFISHVDTSPDMSGANVHPRIIECYDGKDIPLNDSLSMTVEDFPELAFFKGHRLITTDGTTLLGADDKAGVTAIMTLADELLHNSSHKHGKIRIGFTPDEEIGRGVDYFDVKAFGAQYAYTVDGGMEGELEYENFNAASAKITIQGRNIHPGSAKGKMINALQVACDLQALLPVGMRPELTEHYEGFFHLIHLSGNVEKAEMAYIIRDHSKELFEDKKAILTAAVQYLNKMFGKEVIVLELRDQYYNMKEMIEPHPEVVSLAEQAMKEAGVVPLIKPIRGGTDGARLSYMGLPCPNLFTGGMNFHGKFEYCSLTSLEKCFHTLLNLTRLWAELA